MTVGWKCRVRIRNGPQTPSAYNALLLRVRVEISHGERRRLTFYCQPVKYAWSLLWFLGKATEVKVPGVSRVSFLLKRIAVTGAYLSQSGCVGKHGQERHDMASCRVLDLDGVILLRCGGGYIISCCLLF